MSLENFVGDDLNSEQPSNIRLLIVGWASATHNEGRHGRSIPPDARDGGVQILKMQRRGSAEQVSKDKLSEKHDRLSIGGSPLDT